MEASDLGCHANGEEYRAIMRGYINPDWARGIHNISTRLSVNVSLSSESPQYILASGGDSKGFGKKSEGGMIADLPNDTVLTESDVLIGV